MVPLVALDVRCIGQQMTGDTIYWTGLLKGLIALESDVRYLLCSNAPKPDWVPETDRFEWVQIESRRPRWWSLFRFPLVARRRGARAIHVQYNLSPLIAKGGLTTVHDLSFFHEPEWFRPQDRVILQRFVPSSVRRAEKVITVSEFSKSELVSYIPESDGKIVVAHNACPDTIQNVSRTDAKKVVSDELDISGPFLLTVGTRWPRKNVNLAVEAAGMLLDEVPHKLVVTGKSGWGDEQTNDRTVFPGFVSDRLLNCLYAAADAYLAPSLYEGFGITLLEGFRTGCPVIASDIPAHREVGGEACLYQPASDPGAWTKAITSLVQDGAEQNRLRQLGHERESRFTWRDSAIKHEEAYRSVLGC